jgi:hypothetical protein
VPMAICCLDEHFEASGFINVRCVSTLNSPNHRCKDKTALVSVAG